MRNEIIIVLSAVVVVAALGQLPCVSASETAIAAQTSSTEAVNAGNKICPVSGDKVDGKNFYDYNGKRYGLCCPMCAAAFKADPKKYSAVADKEMAGK